MSRRRILSTQIPGIKWNTGPYP